MSPILGIYASSIQNSIANASSYESISTVTVGSTAVSTINFSSIPSTYQHLQIRFLVRCSRTDYTVAAMWARFNSDTGSNYSGHALGANGTNVFAYGGSYSVAFAGVASGANSGSNIFSGGVIDILDYANTNKNKTVRSLSGFDDNSSGTGDEINFMSANWRNTNAINSISLTLEGSSNFLQYSHIALYGIKG